MSLKEKAREVREAGAAERGNYSPKADSVPLRLYNSWAAKRPRKVPTRENFCHYWRVVLIWAPLWAIWQPIEDFLGTKAGLLTLAGIVLAVLVTALSFGGSTAWIALAFTLLGAYAITGIIIGLASGFTHGNYDSFEDNFGTKAKYYFILGVPFFWLSRGIRARARKVPEDKWETIGDWTFKVFIALGSLLIGGMVVLLAITETKGFLLGLALIAAVALLITGLVFLADYLKAKHKKSVEARTKYVPTEEFGYTYNRKVVEPSRVAKFFMAIGDFLNLLIQVVRVKKWKICPIVEIPTKA